MQKIAILGGGMASLATAFALTDSPALRDRFRVTVYQDGWLLGGKGASTRNRAEHDRVEEHGLHVWLGYYENAFTLLRRCYDELGRPLGAALATLREAFLKHSSIVVEERTARGWEHWHVTLPETDDWPGDGRPLPTVAEALRNGARQVLHYARAFASRARRRDGEASAFALRDLLERIVARDTPLTRALGEALVVATARLRSAMTPEIDVDAELRRLWAVVDFSVAGLVGMLREGLMSPNADFEALDDVEFSDWLRRHGASEATLASGLVRAFYHLAFCDGDGAGAGLALLGMMRMFSCYRGAVFYKMRAGMGEVVFAPLHEVLRRRGVRFEFFHRVRKLELSADAQSLARILVDRTARPREGEYEPLVDVGGLPCWPSEPRREQLVDDAATITLERGRDFDHAVLGISIGALGPLTEELTEASPRWRRMLDEVKTVRTVAMQLWLEEPVGRLAGTTSAPVVGAFQRPFETWADMSHVVPHERFGERVRGLLYACGQWGHGDDPTVEADADERAEVTRAADRAIADLRHLWPPIADGREPIVGAPYVRLNASPSDRYVLSVPGSQKHRLAADESGFAGLWLTGDWTRTGYDLGCIETAAMSGLMTARALGAPVAIVGEVPRKPRAPEASLPRYVDRPGEMALRSPYVMERTWMNAFVLRARPPALRALLDRYLNEPGRGAVRYAPAAPCVVLAAAFAEKAFSGDPEHRRVGYMPETDVAFWVPAWSLRKRAGAWIPERLVWFLPHVFVTTGAAAAAGREIYGFPKSVVAVDLERDGRAIARLGVRGEVMPTNTPETCGGPGDILAVERAGGGDEAPRSFGETIQSLLAPLGAPAAWGDAVANRFGARDATLVFLKQFRDVERTDRACYQAVVEAKATVSALRGYGPLPGTYRVTWPDHASHPFASDLGLERGGQEALAATWVDFDFVMQSGKVVG